MRRRLCSDTGRQVSRTEVAFTAPILGDFSLIFTKHLSFDYVTGPAALIVQCPFAAGRVLLTTTRPQHDSDACTWSVSFRSFDTSFFYVLFRLGRGRRARNRDFLPFVKMLLRH